MTMNWTDIIERRKSVRTFSRETPLAPRQLNAVTEAVAGANAASHGLFACTWAEADADNRTFRPSTYGIIKDAAGFIPVAFDLSDTTAALAVGRCLERLVLELTMAGVSTCWLGGTFRASSFRAVLETEPPRQISIVIAVGIAACRKRLIERLTSALAGSHTRKPFDSLFTTADGTPLPPDSPWRKPLEAMRLAPSSLNCQPWRAIIAGDKAHFFVRAKSRDNYVDMGIGLAHVALSAIDHDLRLCETTDDSPAILCPTAQYVCSATLQLPE